MSDYRVDRSLLLERDPEKLSQNMQIASIKDVDWRHQKAAMVAGYNSVSDMAIDELLRTVADLQARVEKLERVEWAETPLPGSEIIDRGLGGVKP